jgi:hypothetical protein
LPHTELCCNRNRKIQTLHDSFNPAETILLVDNRRKQAISLKPPAGEDF